MSANARRSSPSGPVTSRKVKSLTLTVGAVNANITKECALTVAGVKATDTVQVFQTAAMSDLKIALCGSRVTGANAIVVVVANLSAGAVTPTDPVLDVVVTPWST
jgi:hypothetical protein